MLQTGQTIAGHRRIKAICFDAFGTVVEITDKRKPYRPLIDGLNPAAAQALRDRLMREDRALQSWGAALGVDLPEGQLDQVASEIAAELLSVRLRPGIDAIWADLRAQGVKIAICSNLATPYGAVLRDLLPDPPDAMILSYQVGFLKPEPEIYGCVAKALGLERAEILFIGDTPSADVEGPKAAGMQAMPIHAFEADMTKG
ncbi:HAD family hydrolase [Actibacterium ureilyticum]|uniref:HAD family hydrolase n=1 Tax=Actibacterium ureilyticum TaxID=1590614 RepID=UPI00159588A4|nr:HAD family hydrolase [Actibacterium ureilyticum]